MTRVAIPIFRMKVSPVFDSCTRVLLVDIEKNREIDRKEFYLDSLSLNERLTILHKSGVEVVICSGISEVMEKMVLGKKIELISNITGEIESVLKAYLNGELSRAKYHGPGFQDSSAQKGTHTQE